AAGTSADPQAPTSVVWADGRADLSYDRSGNLVDRNVPGWPGLYTHYVYDANDQVRQVTNQQGQSERYFYKNNSRFLKVSDSDGSWHFYLGSSFELVHAADGSETANVYAGGARIKASATCATGCNPDISIYHQDARGDLIAAIGADGRLRAHRAYGA